MKRVVLWGLLFSGAVVAAPVYKWVDANGKVHYSDSPPVAGAKQKTLPFKGGLISSISGSDRASSPDSGQGSVPAPVTASAPPARGGAK